MSEADQERLAEKFAPYVKGSAEHYPYRMKGQGNLDDHLQQIGEAICQLLTELREKYAEELAYQVLERIFTEHFNLIETQVNPKENQDLDSGSLQSADDLEATYRNKRDQGYRGYVTNITETCDPENEMQLITKVQVAPNNGDDT